MIHGKRLKKKLVYLRQYVTNHILYSYMKSLKIVNLYSYPLSI